MVCTIESSLRKFEGWPWALLHYSGSGISSRVGTKVHVSFARNEAPASWADTKLPSLWPERSSRFLVLNWYWSNCTANSAGRRRVTRQTAMSCSGVLPCSRAGQSTMTCNRAPARTGACFEEMSSPPLLMFTVRPAPTSDGPPERVRYRTVNSSGNRSLDRRSQPRTVDSGCIAIYHCCSQPLMWRTHSCVPRSQPCERLPVGPLWRNIPNNLPLSNSHTTSAWAIDDRSELAPW